MTIDCLATSGMRVDITQERSGHGWPERPARQVAFLLIPGFSMLAYASAIEPLRVANLLSGTILYHWTHLTADDGAAKASNGVALQPDQSINEQNWFDFVFVCASDEGAFFSNKQVFSWLRRQASRGAHLGAMGGGAFLLARAGLLVDHRMTLHWAYAATFAEEFPEADLRRSLYEIDRDRITCGGGISSLDMMHALLARDHGAKLAIDVTDWFVHTEIRDGEHAQRLSFQARLGVSHSGLLRALEMMEQSLEHPVSRRRLAEEAGVSERQLDRLFLGQIGTTPRAYYLQLRLQRARLLTTQSALSVLEIATICGFGSASSFSKAYRSKFGESPSGERRKARTALQGTPADHR